ncbi:MAG: hypothetical protein WCQ95_02915 [Bacteroidota bacterium]
MKNNKLIHLLAALSIMIFVGCTGNQPTQKQETKEPIATPAKTIDYSGVYKSNKTGKSCNLTITLTKNPSGYKYGITGEHYDCEGIAIIEKTDAVYITFDGPIGSNAPKTVSGQIDGNTITIQNYGNSMNEYHYFVECDEKYLEFVK